MKKFVLLLFVLATNLTAQAQFVDSVKQYLDSSYQIVEKDDAFVYYRIARKTETGSWLVEDYYRETAKLKMEAVYSDDSFKVKEGIVNSFHVNGKLYSTGKYYHGTRIGLWLDYHINGMRADSMYFKLSGMPYHQAYHWDQLGNLIGYDEFDMSGSGAGKSLFYYEDSTLSGEGKYTIGNLKDSIWVYYRKDGSVSAKEYYDSGDFQKYEFYDKDGNIYGIDCDTSFVNAYPRYDVRRFLAMNTKMPHGIDMNPGSGTYRILIGFVVNRDGSLSNFEVVLPSMSYYNDAAMTVVKKLPRWVPAIHKNRPVTTYYTIPITFRLN